MYRVAFNSYFVPKDLDNGFEYKGRRLIGLDIYITHIMKDKETGEELLFEKIEDCGFMNPHFTANYDNIDGLSVKNHVRETDAYDFDYIISKENSCSIYFSDSNDPESISLYEAIDILLSYKEEFDNIENYPAECNAYCLMDVE